MLWAQNSIKRGEIQTLEKKKAALPELKKEEAEAEELTKSLSSLLPDKKESGRFIIQVEALANLRSVNLADIKFSEEKKTTAGTSSDTDTTKNSKVKAAQTSSSSKPKELTFEMTLKGGYTQLMAFLKSLEKLNRAISIEKADFSEVQGVVQASLKGKVYYKND